MLAGFLGIGFDEGIDTLDQGMFQAFGDRPRTPFLLLFRHSGAAVPLILWSDFQQAFGSIRATVENHILDPLAQFSRNLFVDRQLPGIDDAHIHACTNSVIQEYRVNRLTHRIVTPE